MKKAADTLYTYNYNVEEAQNPYIGFMSFQHFRGEKLYSDIVVTPEAKMTETERVECYPVSHDAEENGREEGYYPDTSIVYIRILWKEFEPERGVFNFKFIEDIINDAKKGARVSGHLSLAGRLTVLMPNTDIITISQKIENEVERKRLLENDY